MPSVFSLTTKNAAFKSSIRSFLPIERLRGGGSQFNCRILRPRTKERAGNSKRPVLGTKTGSKSVGTFHLLALEDNIEYQDVLRDMLDQYPGADRLNVDIISSVATLEALIASGDHIDMFLCDINLGDGKPTGIDLVRRHFPPAAARRSSISPVTSSTARPFTKPSMRISCSNPSSRRISTRLSTRR